MDTGSTDRHSASRLSKGYFICLMATFSWAFTGIFIRYLTETYHLPALVLAFWRDVFVALGMAAVMVVVSPKYLRLESRHFRFLLTFGLVLAVFNTLWTFSVALNGAAVATVLAYSSAAFTALLAWWLLAEPLGKVKILAVSLGILGCIFVSEAYNLQVWRVNPFGILTGLISGVAFAVYSLMGKVTSNRGIHASTTLVYTFGFAAVFLLLANLGVSVGSGKPVAQDLFWLGNMLWGWLVLVILALGPTVGGFGLYTLSLSYLPASVANLIAMLEPVITALLAYLLLGELLTPIQLFGSALIISCLVIIRLHERSNGKVLVGVN